MHLVLHPEGISPCSFQQTASLIFASVHRFSDLVLSNQESHHELLALPLIVDHRAGGADGSWLPALPLPGVWATVQRADRHDAKPGPSADRHCVSRGLLEAPLQAEPARPG